MESTPPPLRFFALYSKNLQTTHTCNFLTFGCGYYMKFYLKFFPQKFSFHPLTALLGHPVQKYYFFAYIKKKSFTKPS